MDFLRSCMFPGQRTWKSSAHAHSVPNEGENHACYFMEKVNQATRTFFKKGTLLEMQKDELEFLPYELYKRSAKREIHLVWDKLPENARRNLADHMICERHPYREADGPRPLIVDCWYCRAERENEEMSVFDCQKY